MFRNLLCGKWNTFFDACDNGIHDGIKFFVKKLVINVAVDKTGFHKNCRHFCFSQDDEPRYFLNTKIFESDIFQLAIDIFCQSVNGIVMLVNQCLHTVVQIILHAGVSVK